MRRIVIVGATGSGKTTLGRRLAAALGVPFTDLDDLYWLPGWQERERADFLALAAQTAATEAWVVAGNYSATNRLIWPRADAIIWLDLPFPVVLRQLLCRCLSGFVTRELRCNGNRESLLFFSRNSIVLSLFDSYGKLKDRYGPEFTGTNPARIRLRSSREIEAFLAGIS